YSGHGGLAPVAGPQGTSHRESLVPVDFNETPGQLRILLDFELNRALAAIIERTTSVAMILDCCHSTGAPRVGLVGSVATARFLDREDLPEKGACLVVDGDGVFARGDAAGIGGGVDNCQVVAACLNHELALEDTTGGAWNGLLTRALVALMGQVETDYL